MGRGRYNYDRDGDIKGARKLKWFEDNLFNTSFWDRYTEKENVSLLDIGSGNGRLNKFFVKHFDNIHNIDLEVELSKMYKYNENITSEITAFDVFETKDKFDVVLFSHVFYIIPEKSKALFKAFSLLKRNGRIVIFEGCESIKDQDGILEKEKIYNLSLLKEVSKRYGYTVFYKKVGTPKDKESYFIILQKRKK